jgi:membrane protein DedA with SNARE-associated domain
MQYIDQLINWLRIHPDYALLITFLVSCAESLIFVGGLIPGSLALSAIGILAGSGVIALYPPLFFAILGAIVGDTCSFFIGRIFKSNLKNFFLFKRYPKTLEYGEFFFEKHGGKSVFLARFIGPIRAIVPAIAGMMGLNSLTFIIANSSSAIGWSALFYFPGVLIGMGHEQIKEHFTQIFYGILLLIIIPIIIIKLYRYLKLKYYRNISEFFDKQWRNALVHSKLLQAITPNRSIRSYYSSAFENLTLVFLLILFLLSFFIKHHFFPPIWLQDLKIANIVYTHTLQANNFIHFSLLFTLFCYFCWHEHKFVWLKSLGLMLLFLLSLLFLVQIPHTKVNYSMMLYSLNVACLYWWSRLLLQFKSKASIYFQIFIFAFIISSQYILNLHFGLLSFSYLTAGLVAGQIAWLHARFTPFYIANAYRWLSAISGLIILELCYYKFF